MLGEVRAAVDRGDVVLYLGPGVLALAGDDYALPSSTDLLAGKLTAAATVPHKTRFATISRRRRSSSRTSSTERRSTPS
jgi:hypothetical protein